MQNVHASNEEVKDLRDNIGNVFQKVFIGSSELAAEARAVRLIHRLGPELGFYLRFYRADNETGDKDMQPLIWFEDLARRPRSEP